MRLNSNQYQTARVGSKNYSTDVVDFTVSSQEEEQGFNDNSSMKTDVHCIAGVRKLHIYTVQKVVPSSKA